MPTHAEFLTTYQHMTDGQLLQVANEGDLIPEAQFALGEELRRRNLKNTDLPRHKETRHEKLEKETKERWFPLARYRSLGFALYGRKFLNDIDRQQNVVVRTRFFVFIIPLIPIASYRFKYSGDPRRWFQWKAEYHVLNRVPLNWDEVLFTWAKTAAWMLAAIAAGLLYGWLKSGRPS
jgi:hypothetical protein